MQDDFALIGYPVAILISCLTVLCIIVGPCLLERENNLDLYHHVAKDAYIGSFISIDKLERMVIDEINKLAAEYLDKDELE